MPLICIHLLTNIHFNKFYYTIDSEKELFKNGDFDRPIINLRCLFLSYCGSVVNKFPTNIIHFIFNISHAKEN